MVENKLTILVVEDNPAYQELYRETLGDDYNLLAFGTKQAAFSYLEDHIPDIALVDVRLVADQRGNEDGLEVVRRIQNLGLKTPIILKSGFPTPDVNVFAILDKSADTQVKELQEVVDRAAEALKVTRDVSNNQDS